jgi:ubiquinone/menaquinone biosynthesis C-methylase UbiE
VIGMQRLLVFVFLGLPLLAVLLHTIVRFVRHFFKFPIPQFLADAIDNPFRRRIQPPDQTPARHGIEPGMTVLEVGPGNGTYTVATARRVGGTGKVVTIDIEPKMIERVRRRAELEGVTNIEARVADVYDLPFQKGSFDAIYMIAVLGEIPVPKKAIQELNRVLSPQGTLAISELIFDPDYVRARTLIGMAGTAGFRLKKRVGNAVYYTLIFEKSLG